MKFEGTPVTYVNAPGAAGINVNGIVATADGRYLIIGKRNENMLFRIDLKTNMDISLLNGRGILKFQSCYLRKYIEWMKLKPYTSQ